MVGVTIVGIPAGGTLYLADGSTVVAVGQTLTPDQAATLRFLPALNFNGSASIEFSVTDERGGHSETASVSLLLASVNDAPTAPADPDALAGSGAAATPIAVKLTGADVDGSVVSVTLASLPAHGVLYLPDGSTPVSVGSAIAAADAARLVFRAEAGYHGSVDIRYTVTDDQGASSAVASVPLVVLQAATTLVLSASASTVAEGGSIVYTATLGAAVGYAPVDITLSNGSTITIGVGQASGSSQPVAMRDDDAYVQGSLPTTVTVSQVSGGDFVAIGTASAIATTIVTDDTPPDATLVTLSASATSLVEGGSIVYSASVGSPVTGSPLVLTLSNGQTLTIPVGASSASGDPYAVRPLDTTVQPSETLTVSGGIGQRRKLRIAGLQRQRQHHGARQRHRRRR